MTDSQRKHRNITLLYLSIHMYVHLSRDENNSRRSAAPPPMLKGAVIPLPFMKAKKNRATTGWTNEGHSLYNVHTSCNKVLLCFTTRDHACHFLSAVKLDMTRLLTLLIVFDMRAWCRLILEVSLLPSGPFWYSFWSSSRRLDTLNVKAIGNNTSGSVASSGKFLKACRSFSKGNLTKSSWQNRKRANPTWKTTLIPCKYQPAIRKSNYFKKVSKWTA